VSPSRQRIVSLLALLFFAAAQLQARATEAPRPAHPPGPAVARAASHPASSAAAAPRAAGTVLLSMARTLSVRPVPTAAPSARKAVAMSAPLPAAIARTRALAVLDGSAVRRPVRDATLGGAPNGAGATRHRH
jgi:hypothetical protein